MIVLGYNGFARSSELFASLYGRSGVDAYRVLGHDAAAALVVDGMLVNAVEEERLSRVKRTADFPRNAIRWCLEDAGLGVDDVDVFAFPWNFDDDVMAELIGDVARRRLSAPAAFADLARLRTLYEEMIAPDVVVAELSRHLGLDLPADRVRLVPHHLAHLMCGYYLAGGGEAAFVVSDGRAEYFSAVAGEVSPGKIRLFDDMSVPIGDSISQLYSKVTRYLGFVPNNDEYKVMGLTAYGEPRPLTANPFLDSGLVRLNSGGRYRIDLDNIMHDTQTYYAAFDRLFGFSEPPGDFASKVVVANAAQDAVERVTAHQIGELAGRTQHRRLLFEGGLALNCVNNARLAAEQPFTDVRVSFGASDPGVAIGAAYYPSFQAGIQPPPVATTYLGPQFDDAEIDAALARHAERVTWRRLAPDDLLDTVVELLRAPVVLGWFQGRTEYGPRALGHRSILANPAHPGIQDLINERVKKREMFRPFAPVVLRERAGDVFELGAADESPYMTFAFPVRAEYRAAIAGAVHVDGTSRIQTITTEQDGTLAELLVRFEKQTGVPALINTSFNVAGEPIVSSPDDALRCFLGTEIDYLVLADVLVTKAGTTAGNSERMQ